MTHSPTTSLGNNHGYRFDGDFVYLNAEVSFSDSDLVAGQSWALQLWACESGFAGEKPSGVKVAEMAIEPLSGGLFAEACCAALPPAGKADQTIALALVCFDDAGQPVFKDLAVYASPQNFLQPCLVGNVSCSLKNGEAEIRIDAIANPRAVDNLSGTLALEIWALDTPYAGGSWAGSPVASLILGVLGGGSAWTECSFIVPAAMPAEGIALTVMLREWTPAGYVTRDYSNFAVPKLAPAKAPVAKAKTAAKPKATVAKKPVESAKETVAPKEKPTAKSAVKAASAKPSPKTVSINKASEDELAAIKGLPRDVAKSIIAARPYATLEDVCKAKGMGLKKLAKLRDLLSL